MKSREVRLWTPILASPAVWFFTFLANYALAPLACIKEAKLILILVWLAGFIITGGAGLLALNEWRQVKVIEADAHGAPSERVRTMALAGLVLSAAFLVVIVAQSLPDFILAGCQ